MEVTRQNGSWWVLTPWTASAGAGVRPLLPGPGQMLQASSKCSTQPLPWFFL